MKITRLGGLMNDDVTVAPAEKIEAIFRANGTILVGQVVGHLATTTVNPTGGVYTNANQAVIVGPVGASASSDHLAIGIYEGAGYPKGAATTTAGFTGSHATTGDMILVTIYGLAKTLVDGSTVDVSPGNPLIPSNAVAGELTGVANFATAATQLFSSMFTLHDLAVTDTTSLVRYVYVKGM